MRIIMKITICTFCFLASMLVSFSQDINKTDAQGKKQGKWVTYWEEGGKIKSEGLYKDGKQINLWQYYYETGELWIMLEFLTDGITVNCKMYHGDGDKAAEGLYVKDKKLNKMVKDGKWYYYRQDSVMLALETYKAGIKDGTEETYYDNGKKFEVATFVNGKKTGPWKQWFDTGVLKVDGNYANDTLDGKVVYYHPNSKKYMEGSYVKGLRSGSFVFYDTNGKMTDTDVYYSGKLSPEDELEQLEKEPTKFYPEDIIYQGFEQYNPNSGGY